MTNPGLESGTKIIRDESSPREERDKMSRDWSIGASSHFLDEDTEPRNSDERLLSRGRAEAVGATRKKTYTVKVL